ncbi:MAG TPA: LamG-like jellyroll fold domain-containing protein [Gemmataceae bacterium]|nr:LamG-like jellyroll fold domain-containing protein [Gemmataceae bacterium]
MRCIRPMRSLTFFSLLLFGIACLSAGPASAAVVASAAPDITPATPTISSTGPNIYISGSATNYVGTPGLFTVSDPGSTVTGYYYGFSNAGLGTFVPAGADGTVSLAITPYDESFRTLYVAAVNGSSPPSPFGSFEIETLTKGTSHVAALAWWKLNAGHGTIAADSTGHLHNAALHKDASLGCAVAAAPDGYQCSLTVGGLGGQARTPPTILPLVGNRTSFSVSVWVNLSKCASFCVAISADGTQTDQFTLAYRKSCTAGGKTGPCWMFSRLATDSADATVQSASSSPGTATLGKWTQLTGVFYSGHGTLTLYVNGVQAGLVSGASPWTPDGNGRARIANVTPGGSRHDWSGRLSNACVFYGVLLPADVRLLHSGNATHPHNGCAALFDLYP